MKTNVSVATLAFLLAGLYIASAQGQPPPAELELMQVNDNLYVIHNDYVPGNSTALITDEGVLLIDDKFENNYDDIVALLRTVTDQPVRYVVNTHYHADHSGSNVKFQDAGADIVATEQARARMVEIDQPGWPRFTMEESARIHIGGVVVDLLHFGRGHTGGDLVVYFPSIRYSYREIYLPTVMSFRSSSTMPVVEARGSGRIRLTKSCYSDLKPSYQGMA